MSEYYYYYYYYYYYHYYCWCAEFIKSSSNPTQTHLRTARVEEIRSFSTRPTRGVRLDSMRSPPDPLERNKIRRFEPPRALQTYNRWTLPKPSRHLKYNRLSLPEPPKAFQKRKMREIDPPRAFLRSPAWARKAPVYLRSERAAVAVLCVVSARTPHRRTSIGKTRT